jgi:two-component sensor histidine kinase/ligand-binding sensor domain-containing protein
MPAQITASRSRSKILFVIRTYFIIGSMLFVFNNTRAQNFDYVTYGLKEGLSQTEVTALIQDSRGYLWVGTAGGGVCKFDGIEFEEFDESHGLGGNIVQCLAEDNLGNIWVGTTFGGITRLDGKNAMRFDGSQGLPANGVQSLAAFKNEVWIGTERGLITWNTATEKMTRIKSMPYNISALHAGNNTMWAGSEGVVYRMTEKIPVKLDLPFLSNSRIINDIADDGKGLLYIATTEGLFTWNISAGANVTTAVTAQLAGKDVHCVMPSADGDIWISLKEEKLLKYKTDGSVTDYTPHTSSDDFHVTALLRDNSGLVWFGTKTAGLIKFRSEAFNYFPDQPGLQRNDIYHFAEDASGKIYIATGREGVFCYDGKTSRPVFANLDRVTCLLFDKKQRLWIAHGQGLALSANGTSITQRFLDGIRVRWVTEDSKGNIWIGTWEKGLYKYDGTTLRNFTTADGLPMNYVHAIKEDSKGIIWIGTGSGLTRYDGNTFVTYNKELCNTYVGSITEDRYGAIWFNTDKCVMRYDGTAFTAYDQKDGLRSNTIYLVQFDKDGDLWVGTNKGVDRLKTDSKGRIVSIKNFGLNEGFRGIECNSRASICDHNGRLWFGTVEGAIRYNKEKDKANKSESVVHITDIRLFLEPTNWLWKGVRETGWFHLPDSISLPHDQNHLTFYFRGVDLASPKNVSYKFMLSGFDSTWSPLVQKNDITYANLPPGVYKFLVKSVTNDGIWNDVPASSCSIRILEAPVPFYASNWFILLLFGVSVGAVYLLITVRTRRIRIQKDELETLVQKRTQEITKQNEEKTVMLKEIHHRVKNNLQIISSLLNLQSESIEDPKVLNLFDECRHRISSMALIHEKMYQSKNLVNINVREYISDLITSLIDVYDLDKKIKLRTEIEDHAFSIDTLVPVGLILSETISNAMKYAFVGRTEGTLFISLRKTSNFFFELTISDNGVGMPHNMDVKSAKTLGLQLIHLLADQVDGRIVLEPADGTRWVLVFKNAAP